MRYTSGRRKCWEKKVDARRRLHKLAVRRAREAKMKLDLPPYKVAQLTLRNMWDLKEVICCVLFFILFLIIISLL